MHRESEISSGMMLLVTAWIPARFCTRLDLFALRLKMDRRKALEGLLCVFLEMEDVLKDLERMLE